MESQTLTVGEVADRVGVSSTTVRRYGDKYAAHLSDRAKKRPRTFTETDVARLTVAYQMVGKGANFEEVSEAIKDLKTGDVLPRLEAGEEAPLAKPGDVSSVDIQSFITPYLEAQVTRAVDLQQRRTIEIFTAGAVVGILAFSAALALVGLTVWLFM